MSLEYRRMRQDDVDCAVAWMEREGWVPSVAMLRMCMEHDPEGCLVAEVETRPVGMVTAIGYARSGWVGHLIVDSSHRRQGIGLELMQRSLDYLERRQIRSIRLEADPPGVSLYRRLGFVEQFESLRFRFNAPEKPKPSPVQSIGDGDLASLTAMDADCFGEDRSRLLQGLYRESVASFMVGDQDIEGFVLVQSAGDRLRVGPLVAEGLETATLLLKAVGWVSGGRELVAGVPGVNATGIALYESFGGTRTPSSVRMIRGEALSAGRRETIYAIANGACG